tara:strand:- start:595 stop:708 length:114 start_codon:yes stop_codon:yes gene_type:complete
MSLKQRMHLERYVFMIGSGLKAGGKMSYWNLSNKANK